MEFFSARIGYGLKSTSNRGHNGDDVRLFDRCRVLLEIANILVVEIDIYKGAQLSVFGEKMLAQVGMLGD